MGILDQVTGALRGGSKGSGVQGLLMQQLVSYLCRPGALANLTSSFSQHGLTNVLESWLGSGQNLPISPSQVQQVLGADVVSDMANKVGLDTMATSEALSRLLPKVVDKITPDGQQPAPDELGDRLSSLGKLFG